MHEPLTNFEDTKTAYGYKTDTELRRIYFLYSIISVPWIVKLGTFFINFCLWSRMPVQKIIRNFFFNHFCGGETIETCQDTLLHLRSFHIKTILDYSVENNNSEVGYEDAKNEALDIIDYATGKSHIPFVVLKISAFGSTVMMEKAQSNEYLSLEEKEDLQKMEQRIEEIILKASKNNIKIMFDAEESWFQDFADEFVYRMMGIYNMDLPRVYNTFQLYRQDMFARFKKSIQTAKKKGYHLGAKLVRGAYMEKEHLRAKEQHDPSPIHQTKALTDRDFNHALELAIEYIDHIGICCGSHNEQSNQHLVQLMHQACLNNNDDRVYFAQLLGMSDHISFKLAQLGYNVAKYVPYGPLTKVLPYLFRRAKENTAIAGQGSREYELLKKERKRRLKK